MSSELSLAFIEHNPTAAARALSALPAADAATYLASIPARYSVRSLSCMSTWSAAKLIQKMPEASAASILRALPYLRGAAILRLIPPEARGFLENLPRALRRDFKTTMSYPSDTVGGQMALNMVVVEPSHTIADVRQSVQRADSPFGDSVFVVDDRRRYRGSINISALFRHSESAEVGDVPLHVAEPLLARQSLESVGVSDRWGESHYLPVVGRGQHLVGVLAMHQALSAIRSRAVHKDEQDVPHTLLETYLDTGRSLLMELSSPRAPKTGDHQS